MRQTTVSSSTLVGAGRQKEVPPASPPAPVPAVYSEPPSLRNSQSVPAIGWLVHPIASLNLSLLVSLFSDLVSHVDPLPTSFQARPGQLWLS